MKLLNSKAIIRINMINMGGLIVAACDRRNLFKPNGLLKQNGASMCWCKKWLQSQGVVIFAY